jgi:hypothetical protein
MKELFKDLLKNIFGILGFIASVFSELGWKWNLVFITVGLLITVIIHLIFKLEEISNKKYLKVKGRVQGNGIHKNDNLIRIESNPKLSKGTLLTLVSKGNGLANAICVLNIVDSVEGEEIQARQIIPTEMELQISDYFVDMNKLDNLFVTTQVKIDELQKLKTEKDETI